MDKRLTIISLGVHTRLGDILEYALQDVAFDIVTMEHIADAQLTNRRILIAVTLDEYGLQREAIEFLRHLRMNPNALSNSVGAVLLDGQTELYTKEVARMLVFDANRAGCRFPIRPLVEATGSLRNFDVLSGVHGVDRYTAYQNAARELVVRLLSDSAPKVARPNILMLHASNRDRSNTLALGERVAQLLKETCDVTELSLLDGTISDCNGCTYKECTHFAEQESCFYGGVIQEAVYPALARCDGLLLCCPNYNDAPGAQFLALNNRLNALLLRGEQFDKALFAIVVSGYSAGDLVAKQLLNGFCLNKPFRLPPYFALLETANDPGTALELPNIDPRIRTFASGIEDAFR